MPLKVLKLERIGGGRSERGPGLEARCSKIVAVEEGGRLVTQKMNSHRDYSNANGVGTRGVYDFYTLYPGNAYEIVAPQSWKRSDHYYLFITNEGEKVRMTYEEVIECLSGGSVSMC